MFFYLGRVPSCQSDVDQQRTNHLRRLDLEQPELEAGSDRHGCAGTRILSCPKTYYLKLGLLVGRFESLETYFPHTNLNFLRVTRM